MSKVESVEKSLVNGDTTATDSNAHGSLSEDELVFHRRLIRRHEVAQQMLDEWFGHLAQKYQLGPADRLTVEGRIVRGQAPAG